MTRFLMAALATAMIATPAYAKGGKKGKKGGDGRDLTMEAGTIQLGGSATVDIVAGGGNTNVGVNLYPSGGYFVADSVELFGNIGVGVNGGATSFGAGVGGKYFIDVKPNWVYVGLGVGYGSQAVSVGGLTATVSAFTVSPQGGFLVALGKNVGLDLGTRIDLAFAGGGTLISVPVGMLGVQAFF